MTAAWPLSKDLPPANPIRVPGWAGLAFDRNVHEDLAPTHVWLALFSVHTKGPDSRVVAISAAALKSGGEGTCLEPSLAALREYLLDDARFLRDHYLYPPSQHWIVRLDQDVTLFAGERAFMQAVVDAAGGLQALLATMVEEFDAGAAASVGLRGYLASLTALLSDGGG